MVDAVAPSARRAAPKRSFTALAQTCVAALSAAVIAMVIVLGFLLVRGYRPVIITTGSMAPTAPVGSVVIAKPATSVQMGDILVMRRDGRATVTHRVIEIERNGAGERYAITRGDANAEIDAAPYPVAESELVGRWVVPGVGRVLLALGSPVIALGVVLLAVMVLATGALRKIWDRGATGDSPRAPAPPVSRKRNRTVGLRSAALATVIGVLLGGGGVAWSLYLGVASVGGNVFSSSACYDAKLGTVQKGQLVNAADGVQTATIGAVDPTASFLLFSVRSASNEPSDSVVMGRLLDATTVEFTRQTDAGAPPAITIEWSVVEYACGVSVQRGVLSGDGTDQIDVPIAAFDPVTSFVTSSSVSAGTATDFQQEELQIVELLGGNTVRLRSGTGSSFSPLRQFAWQVVTFSAPGDAAVQNVSTTLGPGSGSTTITLPTPVDPETTLVLASTGSPSVGSDIGERMVRVRLVDPTTIEVVRPITTDSIEVAVQVIELRDGSTVQSGIIDLSPAEFTETATISPVDLSRTVAISTVMVPGSMSGGASDHVADDIVGEASAAVTLVNASTVSVERDVAASTASFPWQAITWGGPSWADPLSPFRQRIDITAGSVDAPNGYTTPLTLDHDALVSSGLALASGNDARIWRYDGVTWTELDRVIDESSTWNAADTTIWFRTQESIAASETISYWLYFGNPTPPPVLADPANVWLLVEGFEGGTLGQFEDRSGTTAWYRALPWTRRIVLTVDAANVGSNLTDQQILVHLTDADLAANAQADGSDIRFTDADGSTALPHEIEAFDSGTGALSAWVRVPFLSSATDTTMHLYYGAADAPSQEAPRQVWAGETAAWHLARDLGGPAPTLDDSSLANHDGLALGNPILVATSSGPAADLDGTTDRLESAPFDLSTAPFTVAAWFRADTLGSDAVIVSQGDPTLAGVFELAVDTSVTPTGRFRIRTGGASNEVIGGVITPGAWHLLVGIWDGSNATLLIDGVAVGTTPTSGTAPDGSAIPVVLGGDAAGASTLDGLLGEVRLAATAWSADIAGFVDANLRTPTSAVTAAAPTGGTWFDQGDWTIRRPLTVAAAQVAGPLTDYPLLVQVADLDLGANAQTDGDDLVFVDADGLTRLDYEIESWNPGSGALTAWVRLPSVDNVTDTELFLYLGNPGAGDQGDSVGVWGPDADLVLLGS
jgi:signal peptidase I